MDQDLNGTITETVKAHEAELIRYAMSFLKSRDSALDAVQDTFIKLVRICREPAKTEIGNRRAWLYKTLRNQCIDLIRAEKRRREDGSGFTDEQKERIPHPGDGPDKGLEKIDMVEFVRKQIDNLQEREREILLLKIDHGKSYKEISELMDITVGNVGFILHSTVRKLKDAINGEKVLQ